MLLLLSCVAFFPGGVAAQPQTAPLPVPFRIPAVEHGSIDFGDADGDGDLDVAIVGGTLNGPTISTFQLSDTTWSPGGNTSYRVEIYRRMSIAARPVSYGAVRWGDYDGDGDDDLLVTGLADYVEGTTRFYEPLLEVYQNDGVRASLGGRSLIVSRTAFPGLYRSAADWGDYDGDGDLDFAVAGLPSLESSQPVAWIYRNEGASFRRANLNVPGVFSGALAWGDYDGDDDLDLAIIGDSGGGVLIGRLLRNDGERFTDTGLDLPRVAFGSLDWGDYDSDGDPDLLVSGGRLDPRFLRGVTKVYRNDAGTLVDGGFDFEGHALGEARWGDADRDGDLDVFAVGTVEALEPPALRLYTFDGTRFVPTWLFSGVRFGAMAVGDYNGDGDADVVVSGELSTGGLRTQFLMNRDYFECIVPSWVGLGQSTGNC